MVGFHFGFDDVSGEVWCNLDPIVEIPHPHNSTGRREKEVEEEGGVRKRRKRRALLTCDP